MKKRDWDEFNIKSEEEIEDNEDLKNIETKVMKREWLTEEEIEKGIEITEKIMNKTLKIVFDNREKEEGKKEEEEMIGEKEMEDKEDRKREEKRKEIDKEKAREEKTFLDSLDWTAFKETEKEGSKENKTINKLPWGVDGKTAKMIRIKWKLIEFRKELQRIILRKKGWNSWLIKKLGKIEKFSKDLGVININDEDQLKGLQERIRNMSNNLAKSIYRRKGKYRKEEITRSIKATEEEGWKGTKKFYDKLLKRFEKRKKLEKYRKNT